jgi:hypothetical protein
VVHLEEEFRLLTLQVIGEAILSLPPEECDRVRGRSVQQHQQQQQLVWTQVLRPQRMQQQRMQQQRMQQQRMQQQQWMQALRGACAGSRGAMWA